MNKVYDPCCGSGGLLLKFAKIPGVENVHGGFFGQKVNLTTRGPQKGNGQPTEVKPAMDFLSLLCQY